MCDPGRSNESTGVHHIIILHIILVIKLTQHVLQKKHHTVQWSLLTKSTLTMAAHVPAITHKDHIWDYFHLPQACDSITLNYWPHLLHSEGFHTDRTKRLK